MSRRSIVKPLVAGATLAALGACTALPVRTDINPNMSVANCHSYAFADEHVANTDQPSAFGNPLNAERLRQAIESNMAAKGIQKTADRKSAECVVGYAMGTRQVFDDYYGNFGIGWGWGGGWGRRGFGGGIGYDGPYVRDETRISVDLFDARSRTPIWHASVSQSVSDLTGPNAVEKINAAANAIFTKFPSGAPLPTGGHTMT
ncbi:MAG TPA: DUF4136 domain-containing protein [Steroidobacteraceae bacterium]|nr:DUF4136 domain-containing protein [Steroidobacteraceae bacterium]